MLSFEEINKLRRTQTIVSIILFATVFFLFWNTTQFDLKEIQLSYWGLQKFGWIWNSSLMLLSISIYINVHFYIKNNKRIIFRKFLYIWFFLVSLSLFLTGLVTMHHASHDITAYIYFFAYPLSIFLLAHLNRKHLQYSVWKTHLIFSIATVTLPLLLLQFFPGMAIPETAHTLLVIGWNLRILFEE